MKSSAMNLTMACLLAVAALHGVRAESKYLPQKTLTPEEVAQEAYAKAVANPDKAARSAGIAAFVAAKPTLPQSWQMLYQTAANDPDSAVRLEAFKGLANMPTHDATVAKMMIAVFNGLKPNDLKDRIAYGKVFSTSEFKADLAATLADQLGKMRYAEEARYGRTSDKAKEEVKQKRQELMDMLEAFNDIAKSDVSECNKGTPEKVKKWWAANAMKLEKADAEILAIYAKADAEAAQAAKLAKEKPKEKDAAK
jgi:tRNA-binding EMAP/Myf-like protein